MYISHFRKRPVVVAAAMITEDCLEQIADWCGGYVDGNDVVIPTLEGNMRGTAGEHYIIRGTAGEFYPHWANSFLETYEPISVQDDFDVTPLTSPRSTRQLQLASSWLDRILDYRDAITAKALPKVHRGK